MPGERLPVAVSQAEVAESRMVIRATPQRPAELAVMLCDGQVIDAREATLHQALCVELPILVAIAAEPETRVIMPFVSEAHGNVVAGAGPQLLEEPIIQLARPFALQECTHLLATYRELGPIPPLGVFRVDLHHPIRVAAVPGIFRHVHLLRGGLDSKRWYGRAGHHGGLLMCVYGLM